MQEQDKRAARRARMDELVDEWLRGAPRGDNPVVEPAPEWQIFAMREWLDEGHTPETCPAVVGMRNEEFEVHIYEYAALLAEEANDEPDRWRRVRRGDK